MYTLLLIPEFVLDLVAATGVSLVNPIFSLEKRRALLLDFFDLGTFYFSLFF
jgi:hypothetical protein